MVADWDCIVRNLLRVADGRVKPGRTGVESRFFGGWYYWENSRDRPSPGATSAGPIADVQ
jgi:hypothetical protein